MIKYIVYVDDNYHHGDESERYKLGEFSSCKEATEACKKIVDEYFNRITRGKNTFKEIWDGYTLYGEDPFIVSEDQECKFSAWDYAKQRSREFCSDQ